MSDVKHAILVESNNLPWFASIEPWQWLIAAIVLLMLETAGLGGFVIGVAIACLVQSVISYVWLGLSWDVQLVIFAFNAIIFTILYWCVFRKFNQQTDNKTLNNRAAQLIGLRVTIQKAIPSGEGKVIIGDTFWKVSSAEPLGEGDTIVVTASEGMRLIVEKVKAS